MKRLFVLLVIAVSIAACGSTQVPVATPSPTVPEPTRPVPTPTMRRTTTQTLSPALQHVVEDNGLTPGLDFPDGKVSDSLSGGVLRILEDLGSRSKYPLNAGDIHFGCFLEFEAIYVPSPRLTAIAPHGVKEVDIRFTFGSRTVGSCRLTSKTAASIPWFTKTSTGMEAGIDMDDAWKLYDSTSVEV